MKSNQNFRKGFVELEKRILTFTWKKTQETRDRGWCHQQREQADSEGHQAAGVDGLGECPVSGDGQTGHGTDCRRGMSGPSSPEQSRSHVVRCSGTVASVWKSNMKPSCHAMPRNALLKARDLKVKTLRSHSKATGKDVKEQK